MAKIWVEAYGCSASFADSEMISGLISNGGHTLAENESESDLNLIVTCSVKDATATRMVHRIKESQSKPLVVAGCLPKAERHTVEKFAQNASLMGPNSIGKTLQIIETTLGGSKIVALEAALTAKGQEEINVSGYLVSPPFVDAHFHMDATLSLGLPRLNQS